MSFNDLETKRGGAVGVRPSGQVNDFKSLSDDLQAYQRSWMRLKDKIPDMRRRKVSMAEKNELETQIRDTRETENRLKSQLELQSRQLDALQRGDASVAQKRIALGKLSKDFDRVKLGVQAIIGEASLIKATAIEGGGGGGDGFNRRGGGGGGGVGGGGGGESDFGANGDAAAAASTTKTKHEHIFQQAIVGRDVDDLIMEERERDIRKMNQDLLMVNEMFRDMANIVEQQGEHIETIAVTTEKSHDRAKAGLEQVKQAASHQNSCNIS